MSPVGRGADIYEDDARKAPTQPTRNDRILLKCQSDNSHRTYMPRRYKSRPMFLKKIHDDHMLSHTKTNMKAYVEV